MTQPRYDVVAVGNAIVDVMAPCEEALIEQLGMTRGGMTLIDTDQARSLYAAMGPAREVSGGSAANTLAGLAALGWFGERVGLSNPLGAFADGLSAYGPWALAGLAALALAAWLVQRLKHSFSAPRRGHNRHI